MSGISRDDWMKALDEAGLTPVNDPTAITVHEFAALMGVGVCTARTKLRALVKAGRATETTKTTPDTSGRPQARPAYRLIEKADATRSRKRTRHE